MFDLIRLRKASVCLAATFATLTAAAAAHAAPEQRAVPNGSIGAEIGTYYSAGNTGLLSNVTNPNNTESNSSTFANVAGMTTKITVPTGKKALLVSRFSAESACAGSVGNYCSVRILVDGHEAAPATDFGFAFSTVSESNPGLFQWQGNSMDRASEVGSGQHTIVVQAAVTDTSGSTYIWLGERSLTVESAIHP